MKLPRVLSRLLGIQAKAADEFIPADTRGLGHLPRTRYPYSRDIGPGLESNVIMSPMNWIMRNFTEAEPTVQALTADIWEWQPDHALSLLLQNPNPFYDGDTLWKATALSWWLDGNAYWLKVRGTFGDVIALWYLPHFLVRPMFPQDGSAFISHYEYRPVPSGGPIKVPVRDMVHLRFGLDPENVRLGLSTLKPLLREVFTDEEAANFAASILRNMGVPGGILSPKDGDALPSEAAVEKMKNYVANNFTGDKRGEWLVLGTPTEVGQFGFDPNQLMLANLRDITEERVCAAFGIPAAVVGFGSGLQSTKVGATMRELRQLAWKACITPTQKSIAKQVTKQIMPDFASQMRRFRVRFNMADVAEFQEEMKLRAEIANLLTAGGILRVDRAQKMLGLEVDPTREIYLGPGPAPDEPPDAAAAGEEDEIPAAVAARMNGNGNGRTTDDEE